MTYKGWYTIKLKQPTNSLSRMFLVFPPRSSFLNHFSRHLETVSSVLTIIGIIAIFLSQLFIVSSKVEVFDDFSVSLVFTTGTGESIRWHLFFLFLLNLGLGVAFLGFSISKCRRDLFYSFFRIDSGLSLNHGQTLISSIIPHGSYFPRNYTGSCIIIIIIIIIIDKLNSDA